MNRPDQIDHRAQILIVDDERSNRQLLRLMLAPEGFELAEASTGEQALDAVQQTPPDLILLDVMMPGMNGFDVTLALKSEPRTKSIPIILVTALDDREAKMRGLGAGAEDFVTKPIDRGELCVRVRNLLRLKAYGDYHDRYSQLLEVEVGARAAELVGSERLYRSTFDAAPIGIGHLGLDGRWLLVNPSLCEFFGHSSDELKGRALTDLMDPLDVARETAAFRALVDGAVDRHVVDEARYRRPDGAIVYGRTRFSLHRDGSGESQHLIAVVEDITAHRNLESQLRQATKMDAIGQLAAGVAHDFNNHLSVVLTYSELLASDLREGDPMRADLEVIRAAGKSAAGLTHQLLAFSRKQVLQPQVVDLVTIVQGTERMLHRLIGEDIQLSTTGPASVAPVLVDPGQMEQVLMNLAVNGRDAMPRGGSLVIGAEEVMLDEDFAARHVGVKEGRHVLLTVRDTGAGMDRATQARVFEPFFTTKAVGAGTGLGLSTVFGIVQQSGATIWLESEVGRGTVFKIYFPVASGTAVPRPSSPPPNDGLLTGSETILVVEDDERVRVMSRAILRRYGYQVLDAQGGGDAILLCEQHRDHIDLLLTDVVMPRMSGRELAERLLATRPTMRVLYMTGYPDEAVARHGIAPSALPLIQKPITPESLARRVREALGLGLTASDAPA